VQADGTSTRGYGGSGIGLSLVKDIVDLHKGKVYAESGDDKGTTFVVELLKGMEHIDKSFLTEDVGEDRELEELRYSNLVKKTELIEDSSDIEKLENEINVEVDKKEFKVLVVEDNPDMYRLIAKSLANIYEVYIANDGEKGLEKIKQYKPDLVISDVMMPVKDGLEMLAEIRADEEIKKIPVIMLSAKAEIKNKIKGLESGANDYIAKPFNTRELLVRIAALLMQKKYENELEQTLKELNETP